MIQLTDGPAVRTYAVKRAPMFLRAVVAADGTLDVLDQLGDTPATGEAVHVYQRDGEASSVHIRSSKRGVSGFYASAVYHYLPDVDGEELRDNDVWQAWCTYRFDSLREQG